MLTVERLRQLLDYNPGTGAFIWVCPTSHRVFVGSLAGTPHNKGYRKICVDGVRYFAHRLAWLYMTGEMPKEQIDHINRDTTDDRFINLRQASSSQNQRNREKQANNTSGFKGGVIHCAP